MDKKAVILCDGELPDADVISNELCQNSLFIAADGGADRARELKLVPDVIIGDLDSFSGIADKATQIIHDPDQETNDLEKALKLALDHPCSHIVVFGATGKRIDHTLKNLSVLLQFDSRFESLQFLDRYSRMFLIHSQFREDFPPSTSLSLFPLSGEVTGITTSGLRYPLRNETLRNGERDGTSNETIGGTVEIEFETGDLLLIVNHRQI